LAPTDLMVQNEFGYLLFKKALENVSAINARDLVEEATALLKENIAKRGTTDPHPYHVYGSQGLAWSKRGLLNVEDQKIFLTSLLKVLDDGVGKHPNNDELKTLRDNVKGEYLNLALR
jgi:hypothetical protein